MPSASFSSSRSYVRRSRRKNGNRIPLPSRTTGKRASELTNATKKERVNEASVRVSEETKTEARRSRGGFVQDFVGLIAPSHRDVGDDPPGSVPAVYVYVPLFPGLCTHASARHAPRFLLALAPLYPPIAPRTRFCLLCFSFTLPRLCAPPPPTHPSSFLPSPPKLYSRLELQDLGRR